MTEPGQLINQIICQELRGRVKPTWSGSAGYSQRAQAACRAALKRKAADKAIIDRIAGRRDGG